MTTDGLRAFHNLVKTELIKESARLTNGHVLYDTTVGMGGDLHKWVNNGFTHVYGSDIRKESLEECKSRYERKKASEDINLKLILNTGDLRTQIPFEGIGASVVTCFFSIHYFLENPAHLTNLFRNAHLNIAPNGVFILTFLNGDAVDAVFKKNRTGRLNNGVVTIERKYLDPPAQKRWVEDGIEMVSQSLPYRPYNSRIKFKLESVYFKKTGASHECLVSPSEIRERANEYGFSVVREGSFRDYFEKATNITQPELQVSNMHYYMIFRNRM